AVEDMRGGIAEAEHIAVGRGTRDAADPDGAVRPTDILDDDAPAERYRHPLGDDARDRVGRSAGGERHVHHDRTRWINLRRGGPDVAQGDGERNDASRPSHATGLLGEI